MNFKWDDEDGWVEGERPKRSAFLDWAKEEPGQFFMLAVGVFIVFSLYGGKVIMWVIKWFVG
jgi:hypothetical protein